MPHFKIEDLIDIDCHAVPIAIGIVSASVEVPEMEFGRAERVLGDEGIEWRHREKYQKQINGQY